MTHDNRGTMVMAPVLVFSLVATMGVVMALSTQSAATRSVQSSGLLGRYAAELAESAVDECRADFDQLVKENLGDTDLRFFLLGRVNGNTVPGEAISARPWTWSPVRTLALAAENQIAVKLGAVTV